MHERTAGESTTTSRQQDWRGPGLPPQRDPMQTHPARDEEEEFPRLRLRGGSRAWQAIPHPNIKPQTVETEGSK